MHHNVSIIVLTGGRSSRLGGRHKPGIVVEGHSVIDRTVSTIWQANSQAQVIIAGPATGLSSELAQRVTVVREDPPFSGPVAGVAAGLKAVPESTTTVMLLGGDMPFLTAATLTKLLQTVASGAQVASCVDATGHLQYLCAAWPHAVLVQQVQQIAEPAGVPLKALFRDLTPAVVECDPRELRDIDTPQDLAEVVTTADGRPIPTELLAAVARFSNEYPGDVPGLGPDQLAQLLDFARDVKYAPSAANPVVAAFLAGQLVGTKHDVSPAQALRRVLKLVEHPDHP